MQAAITAAERGHKVLLMEKEKKLGGQINLAVVPPGKEELKHIRTYLLSQLRRKRGRIKVMHQEATPSLVEKLNCDVVITAVGSSPFIPNIPGMKAGMKRKLVVTGREILSGKIKLGKKAVVIGGGMIGCEIADYLAEKGQEVAIIEILPELAMDAFFPIRKILLKRLEERRVQFFTKVREERITTGGVEIVEASGERRLIQADKIIVAAGSTPNTALSRSFSKKGVEFYAIGDCKESRKILEAIHEAYSVAMNL